MVYLIAFLAACLCLLVWLWYRQSRRSELFLHSLTQELLSKGEQRQPLMLTDIPESFSALVQAIQHVLLHTPLHTTKDKLTGLPNRVGFKRAITHAMPLTSGTLVLIDLYRFRYVNDLFGFAFGDTLLQLFADRLRLMPKKPRQMARMNGDEFLLYFDTCLDAKGLLEIKQLLQQPFSIQDTPVSVRLQMGYVQLAEHHADVSQMLRRADLALKRARSDKDMLAAYQQDDDISQRRELFIINNLPKALAHNQLYLVYQPKESLHHGGCEQVEALIRWEHPELGLISPAEFIPLAEYAGMIDLVSAWALEQVLMQQVRWRAEGIHIRVAVNLSVEDMQEGNLPSMVEAALARYHLPGEVLALEITESTLMSNLARATDNIVKLRGMGVKVAIDDFGTGHSSLAYLKDLPADEVKIDRAFLDGIMEQERARNIMTTSIQLAKRLGFEVTVEGVESDALRKMLAAMGADNIQGQYFARPMRALELEMDLRRLGIARRA
ncbi:putative bifunctional diguanylate cyclase/phosphodiesterase [Shewanella zhangzhouensis]|uniref:putative bifunctional diguanylate cyclase/phosphodiesterase n=1 Tax=Shewanella zhangzhouensis TaxID=2864213 RepID=UPI001C65CB10|nr:bifunctional diguanylate cyclase/phosphodiesterase [Shewanella zhangzhouensis]QYK06276.1 bifunctional diguanylate cyclase/phosphodiesterase [Shewanella zhangzhouensis]